jgi:hypothetical protein
MQKQTPHIVDTNNHTETDRAETGASIHHVTLQGVLYEEKMPYVGPQA